ncbi:MAG: transcriptional repressor [Methanosarcinales archaeon]|nr:transcriptional repressor [Methanosarcinales archaeon]
MSEGMALSMDKLRDFLENEGIHTSYHRLKILEYLRNHRTHPTVERMHKELSREIPTLSKTTVYNTLKLFVRKGLHQS